MTFMLPLIFYQLYYNIFVLFPSFLSSGWLNSKKLYRLWHDIWKKYFHFFLQRHTLTEICQTSFKQDKFSFKYLASTYGSSAFFFS